MTEQARAGTWRVSRHKKRLTVQTTAAELNRLTAAAARGAELEALLDEALIAREMPAYWRERYDALKAKEQGGL